MYTDSGGACLTSFLARTLVWLWDPCSREADLLHSCVLSANQIPCFCSCWKVMLNRWIQVSFQHTGYCSYMAWLTHVPVLLDNVRTRCFQVHCCGCFTFGTDLGSWRGSDVPLAIHGFTGRSFAFLQNLYRLHNSFRTAHLKLTR